MENEKIKVILVGLLLQKNDNFDHELEELEALCDACDMQTQMVITQALEAPNKALYIGTGKVEEVRQAVVNLEADMVVFNDSLSPSQARNLSDELNVPILDRTAVILQIFDERAKTREAQLQVELARLQYMLPRLSGMGVSMSRQGGGTGSRSNRGAGEKKLELDRRYIKNRITECKRELIEVERNRQVQRKSRMASALPQISLVGYTNAGKSTVMNQMLEHFGNDEIIDNEHKLVLQKDMLFATLDTTVRKITPKGRPAFYLSDTVGFIDKLPHHLVDAFRSTLEEAVGADLLLQVVDVSDPHHKEHMQVTQQTLQSLGAGDIPMLVVYNKADLVPSFADSLPIVGDKQIHMAAGQGEGIEELLNLVLNNLFAQARHLKLLIPYTEGAILSQLTGAGTINQQEYRADGTYVEVDIIPSEANASLLAKAEQYSC